MSRTEADIREKKIMVTATWRLVDVMTMISETLLFVWQKRIGKSAVTDENGTRIMVKRLSKQWELMEDNHSYKLNYEVRKQVTCIQNSQTPYSEN